MMVEVEIGGGRGCVEYKCCSEDIVSAGDQRDVVVKRAVAGGSSDYVGTKSDQLGDCRPC